MRRQGLEVQYYPAEDDETLELRKSAHKPGSVAKAKQILEQFGTLLPDPLNRPIEKCTNGVRDSYFVVGHWIQQDAMIFLAIANRIVKATVEHLQLKPRGGPLAWPNVAYRPSQQWTAKLYL
jgi:hypothetical protein